MVRFDLLFRKLQSRGLPLPLLRFLSNWYFSQEMSVCWGPGGSKSFGVSNGVRQGGVLSPLLFSVYMDGLIEVLSESGVGCYWGHHFVGTFCYADDVVLLAPCVSALRRMLDIYSCYASSHGLASRNTKNLPCGVLYHSSSSDALVLGTISLQEESSVIASHITFYEFGNY